MLTKIEGWSSKDVTPEVKAVLTAASTTLQQHDGYTPDSQTMMRLQEMGTTLAAACAVA